MKTTFESKKGFKITFNPGDPWPILYGTDSPLFKALESRFYDWIETQHEEVKQMYLGSFEELHGGSYLSKRGAIQDAIELVCAHCWENSLKYITEEDLNTMGLEAAFEA